MDGKVMYAGPFRLLVFDPVTETLMKHIQRLERQNAVLLQEKVADLRTIRRDVRTTRKNTAAILRAHEARHG